MKYHKIDYAGALFSLGVSLCAIFFDCVTRGAIVGFVLSCFLILVSKFSSRKATVLIVIGTCAILFIVVNIEMVLTIANNLCIRFGLNIPSISRAMLLLQQNNLDANREDLYTNGIELFKRSPLIGNGVGAFEALNKTYVHNFILDLLCECGLIGTICIVYKMLESAKACFIHNKDSALSKILYERVLTMCAITPLLFSSSLWLSTLIWLYFIYIFTNTVPKRIVFIFKPIRRRKNG